MALLPCSWHKVLKLHHFVCLIGEKNSCNNLAMQFAHKILCLHLTMQNFRAKICVPLNATVVYHHTSYKIYQNLLDLMVEY